MELPHDEIMRELTRLALEQATELLAKQADDFAKTLPKEATGQMAMAAFSAAIRSTNAKVWPAKGRA